MESENIVKIVYLDHVESKNLKDAEMEKVTPIQCTIYGRVVKETKTFVSVQNYFEAKPSFGTKGLGLKLDNTCWSIVKGAIIERKELTIKKGK